MLPSGQQSTMSTVQTLSRCLLSHHGCTRDLAKKVQQQALAQNSVS
jgi:hypothetical protein